MAQTVITEVGTTSRVTVDAGPNSYQWSSGMQVEAAGGGCQWAAAAVQAGGPPLQVDVTCTSLTGGTSLGPDKMGIQIVAPTTSPQPNPVAVLYKLPDDDN